MVSRTGLETNWSRFLRKVATADDCVLIVDYEGTITPSSSAPKRTIPDPEVLDCLQAIGRDAHNCLIVITDRRAAEVRTLLGMTPAPEIWGVDGLERLYSDGRHEREMLNVSPELLQIFAESELSLKRAGLKEIVETRPSGVVVRCNRLNVLDALNARSKAYNIFQPLVSAHPALRLMASDHGVELRLRIANRGAAVQRLLASTSPGVPVAYVGSDTKDEEAFRVLNGRGLTAVVTRVSSFTAAQISLRPPAELVAFLRDWVRAGCNS